MNVSNSHQRTFELLLQPNEFYDYCHVHVIVYVKLNEQHERNELYLYVLPLSGKRMDNKWKSMCYLYYK